MSYLSVGGLASGIKSHVIEAPARLRPPHDNEAGKLDKDVVRHDRVNRMALAPNSYARPTNPLRHIRQHSNPFVMNKTALAKRL